MVKYHGRARMRTGAVNTNQIGLKMSGCPSKIGKQGSLVRYQSRRAQCNLKFCGPVYYQGQIWTTNSSRCVPRVRACQSFNSGVGRINAPRFSCARYVTATNKTTGQIKGVWIANSPITIALKIERGRVRVTWAPGVVLEYSVGDLIRFDYEESGPKNITIDILDDAEASLNYGNPTSAELADPNLKTALQSISVPSNVKIIKGSFEGCEKLVSADLGKKPLLDKDISKLFSGCKLLVNIPNVNSWDTGSVENMNGVFEEAELFNQPIESWDTKNVISMENMFKAARSFDQPIGNWNTGNVQDMRGMFENAFSFNEPINAWNLDSIKQVGRMFSGATNFDQDLSSWNLSQVPDFDGQTVFAGSQISQSSSFSSIINSMSGRLPDHQGVGFGHTSSSDLSTPTGGSGPSGHTHASSSGSSGHTHTSGSSSSVPSGSAGFAGPPGS